LTETGRLEAVLKLVARAHRSIVIVPGGGAFADAVRADQTREGFSDDEAHRLAILAMHDMAADFVSLQPGLVGAHTVADIRAAWRRRRVPIWLPTRMCLRDGTIPQDWSITSDGLAARLAEQLGRLSIVLVKPVRVPRSASARSLADSGIVDFAFAAITRRSGLRWSIAGPGEERTALQGRASE
jgi:aspartokinase-like uncharacterized kinase